MFLILWLAGFAGVLSFQLVDLTALIANIPGAQDQPLPFPMAVVRLLSVLQGGVLVAVAVLVGAALAPKVGLSAPAAQALAERRPALPALRPQLLPGVLGAAIAAPAIIACWLLWKPLLTPAFVQKATGFSALLPPVTRLLYGGVTEELLLRWGFMTFLVWAPWKVLQKGKGAPRPALVWLAIALSALVFGAGHLPIAIALSGVASVPLVTYVIFANAIFGVVGGFLYWKKGLEAAIVAHALTHVAFLLSGMI
ncbi:MAG TPA: CPBP family intramembrane glutamic endopeptidase [Terriglobales bacterium]|nr:CPBP family intramembrane glutamic endopeptidase [Terriglobales bacterium]